MRKLQIGAGPNELAGWLNADFSPRRPSTIFMDATQPFPLPSGSFDLIFSEWAAFVLRSLRAAKP